MSQTIEILREDQDKIKMVVKIWEVKQNEAEKHTNFADGWFNSIFSFSLSMNAHNNPIFQYWELWRTFWNWSSV